MAPAHSCRIVNTAVIVLLQIMPCCSPSRVSGDSYDASVFSIVGPCPSGVLVPDSGGLNLPDFAELFRKVSPSVVNVSASHELPIPRDLLPNSHKDRQAISISLGSGFVFDDGGYIVACSSVVQGGDSIEVSFFKGPNTKARVLSSDDVSDLVVLKVDDCFAPSLPIASRGSLHQGDWVGSFGYPYGLSRSLTVGVVSAIRTKEQMGSTAGLILTDAAVNPGCNGGPLLNINGEVVGINLVSNYGDQILGLAVPVHDVLGVIQTMKRGKTPPHAWIGVSTQYVDASLANTFGIEDAQGALISMVSPGSPAAKAGLRPGDVVTSFDRRPVEDPLTLIEAVRRAQVGRKVYVELIRDSARKKVSVVPTVCVH